MALNLKKNKTINLTKSAPQALVYKIGLSWDATADLDASVVAFTDDDSLVDFVSYAHGFDTVVGITHSGDATDGNADGDDEVVVIDPSKLPDNVTKVVVTITSHVDNGDAVTFGETENPLAKLYVGGNTVEASLDSEAAFGTSFLFVELEKVNNEWTYTNVSDMVGSSPQGLADIVSKFG